MVILIITDTFLKKKNNGIRSKKLVFDFFLLSFNSLPFTLIL